MTATIAWASGNLSPRDTLPAATAQYSILKAFWNRLGWTYRDLQDRPLREVRKYIEIMRIEDREAELQHARQAAAMKRS